MVAGGDDRAVEVLSASIRAPSGSSVRQVRPSWPTEVIGQRPDAAS
ncbi:MAG: hypothetical protein AVDCRST_MAG79-797 [uncultured Thermoleophilia bacterium]|uniref:Uncharacterized protein n=1 Tax=uncultured Thermoleophilia bacterium TaxID=1497501 RepID=A0A6J4TR73_9ACTN|nr:MAG: hypothetical protein AVDCRST_MAG79-797 [uncultured Thermoleophilia bacterium]